MKKLALLLIVCLVLPAGCSQAEAPAQIAATTAPVYTFTSALCQNTGLTVTPLITENVSCLHDYSLSVRQVKKAEAAELIILSGGGLEDFMADLLYGKTVIDSSVGISLEAPNHEGHDHSGDPHFWLSPACAKIMARNICAGLTAKYPENAGTFSANLNALLAELDKLQTYGEAQLSDLKTREIITFHDGFSYFAHSFDLTVLKAVEEEAGSEASASELKELITLVKAHHLPAIFTEENGSGSAANIVARETKIPIYRLSMAISGTDYFDAMYHNIDILKEALG